MFGSNIWDSKLALNMLCTSLSLQDVSEVRVRLVCGSLQHSADVMQEIDGLVLVAPAITAFSADLKAQSNAANRYHTVIIFMFLLSGLMKP